MGGPADYRQATDLTATASPIADKISAAEDATGGTVLEPGNILREATYITWGVLAGSVLILVLCTLGVRGIARRMRSRNKTIEV